MNDYIVINFYLFHVFCLPEDAQTSTKFFFKVFLCGEQKGCELTFENFHDSKVIFHGGGILCFKLK